MKKFAVFDIDGTLIRWQLYHAVVDKLAKQGYLGENAHKKLHESRMVWKDRKNNTAYANYEETLIETFESSLHKISPKTFDELVQTVINEYKDQAYTYTRDLIVSLKKQGYFLVAISGSHKELVEKLTEYYKFDIAVGTNYERKKEKFSGKKFIASINKRAVLENIIKTQNLSLKDSWAVGDTKSDASILEMVKNPIAFNPENVLYEYAKDKHWPIVIERKNVIYKLEYKNGRYVLV